MGTPFLPFLLVGGGELWLAGLVPAWAAWAFVWAGGATTWVSLAYLLRRPGMLGKEALPRVAFWALLPFFLVARGAARAGARAMREWKIELVPGLWVGGWPRHGAPGYAQLDLTAELPRRGAALRYRCVPMLDGAAPEVAVWRAAVEQAVSWRAEGLPVLVHCAYGHGRSVAVCIGVMVAEGLAPTWQAAHQVVLAVRPRAVMTPAQRAMVAAAVATLPPPPATP
ncbi:MAG: hypothetical protein Q8P18_10755 [Pseudomonadota bacterium]|nr:hypothetical protein [Pseudomonadota bacterium]